jgi:prepilin peptidase CpaA
MSRTGLDLWLFLSGVAVFTLTAAFLDWRHRRIPNGLSVAGLFVGLAFRITTEGFTGLTDALGGFAVGFGCMLLVWAMGGGGGGDVKLMGALSVWLGACQSAYVLVLSSILAFVFTVVQGAIRRPMFPTSDAESKPRRKVAVAFAVPLAIATWATIGVKLL